MCDAEGVQTLQRGMNYRLRPNYSVILMSQRSSAPYRDRIYDDGVTIEYEGHDVTKKSYEHRVGGVEAMEAGDEHDFANFANGVWAKTWRRKPPGVPTARGASPTRPPWPSPCRMPTLPSSDSRLWSYGRLNPPNRRMRTRMSGGVAGEAG